MFHEQKSLERKTYHIRMILPTGLYACEIWGGLSNTEIDLLERTQRYAARFIQCMDKSCDRHSFEHNQVVFEVHVQRY
jgi:hypothetical protein